MQAKTGIEDAENGLSGYLECRRLKWRVEDATGSFCHTCSGNEPSAWNESDVLRGARRSKNPSKAQSYKRGHKPRDQRRDLARRMSSSLSSHFLPI